MFPQFDQNINSSKKSIKTLPPKPRTKPKFFNHLHYVLLIVFIILLVAQLRAIELPGGRNNQLTQNVTNLNHENQHDLVHSIDKSANSVRYVQGPIDHKYHGQIDMDLTYGNSKDSTRADLIASNVGQANSAERESDIIQAASTPDLTISHANHPQDYQSKSSSLAVDQDQLSDIRANLAELTAAGTAAGLLVHDLLTQANAPRHDFEPTVDQYPQGYYQPIQAVDSPLASASRLDINDRPLNADEFEDPRPLEEYQQRVYNSYTPRTLSSNNESQDDDDQDNESPESTSDLDQNDLEAKSLAKEATSQVQDNVGKADVMPEPPSEDQMPDSMDSLMRAEGENVDVSDNDEEGGAGLQQVAGSNLVNQNEVRPLNDIDEQDADDDDDEPTKVAQGSVPSIRHLDGELHQFADVSPGLVTPMRDSLSDLNTAAGHYYGKKKKKKVKIVLKKKKKKKKYVKKKKVKVIKIVKKKKKKKKPMKKYHHDHGKYYMYAKVPKKKAWEFGFKKGNKKHWIERHEKGHKNKFKTKVKWYDKKSKGKGLHIWDYNHHDKKKKKHY